MQFIDLHGTFYLFVELTQHKSNTQLFHQDHESLAGVADELDILFTKSNYVLIHFF